MNSSASDEPSDDSIPDRVHRHVPRYPCSGARSTSKSAAQARLPRTATRRSATRHVRSASAPSVAGPEPPPTAPAAPSTDIAAAGLRPLPLAPGSRGLDPSTRHLLGPRVIDPYPCGRGFGPRWTTAGRLFHRKPARPPGGEEESPFPPSSRTLLAIFSLDPTSRASAIKAGEADPGAPCLLVPSRPSQRPVPFDRRPDPPPTRPAMPAPPHPTPLLPPAGEPFRVFVGYDPREHEAYEVCRRSLLPRSWIPLDVRPIRQDA